MAKSLFFRRKDRLKTVAQNNLGIVAPADQRVFQGKGHGGFDSLYAGRQGSRYRTEELNDLEKYYSNTQYDHLMKWDDCCGTGEDYTPIKKRKPKIIYPMAKVICSRVAAKLVGSEAFPTLTVEGLPDETLFFKTIIDATKMKSRIAEPMRKLCALGSVFIRFFITEGAVVFEHYSSKYCYPIFDAAGNLIEITIKYVYEDQNERDEKGNFKQKWFKLVLTRSVDIAYDNPDFQEGVEPAFTETGSVEHNFGFVQGEWFRTYEDKHSPDGFSLIADVRDFIDELCYSLSQSSQAISYNQDPQLTVTGMDEDELDTLIRSSQKAWNLGKEGKGEFLESSLSGVERASEFRDTIRLGVQDIVRIALIDPEKAAAQAQSGEAMKIIYAPMVELISELRPMVEAGLVALTTKIGVALLMVKNGGGEIPVTMPEGWTPSSLALAAQWPPIFPMTTSDLLKRVQLVSAATGANLISRETGTRFLAKDFAVEDIQAEVQKINQQPNLNPFGGF